jgi:hypothetical protein
LNISKGIKQLDSEISSLKHSNSSLQSVSSCNSSDVSLNNSSSSKSNTMMEVQVENMAQVKKVNNNNNNNKTRSKYYFASDDELLNHFDKNLNGYLKYLNDSFTRDTTKLSFNEKQSEYTFGLKSKKIFYQLNTDQMHLYANLNNNRALMRAA